MADIKEGQEKAQEPTTEPSGGAATPDSNGVMIPKARFDEVNQKAKELESRFAELERKQKEEAEQRAKEQGNWKGIAETKEAEVEALTPYKERWETMTTSIAEANKKLIDSLPDDKKSLVPEYDDAWKLKDWLDKNMSTLKAEKQTPNLNGGAGGRQGSRTLGARVTRDDIKAQKLASGTYR